MAGIAIQDLNVLVETAVRAALAAQPAGGHRDPRDHGHLDERHFLRVDKYGGGAGWAEFSRQIRKAAAAANGRVRDAMDEIAKAGKDPDYDLIFSA